MTFSRPFWGFVLIPYPGTTKSNVLCVPLACFVMSTYINNVGVVSVYEGDNVGINTRFTRLTVRSPCHSSLSPLMILLTGSLK